ncbi:MAG: acyltransferase family protein [Crocinitomix sp.]|nr:acyltransferase family protein [Crocinitomix sp.]
MQNRVYLNHVECIRAFAALAVGIYHFTNFSAEGIFLLNNEATRGIFVYGAQGVEIFYIISGFIIPYSLYKSSYRIKNYLQYISKRSIRLLPPYFLTIALIIGVSYYTNTYIWPVGYNIEWRNIGANAFFLVDFIQSNADLLAHFPDNGWINPVFQTLKVEFQFYIIIGLLIPLFKKHTIYLIGISALLLAIGAYTIPENTVFVNAPYFLLGLAAFYIFENGWNWTYAGLLILCLLSLFNFYVWQDLFAGIIGFAMVLWLPKKMKFLKFTGKISYSFYLIHGLIGGKFLYFFRESSLFQDYPFLMVIFALLLSWIGAYLIYFCIEKPSIRISKKIRYKS